MRFASKYNYKLLNITAIPVACTVHVGYQVKKRGFYLKHDLHFTWKTWGLMWRAVHCKLYTCVNVACSRLRDSGEKAFSKKKCEKRAAAGERASYFRFARFNTSASYTI